MLPNFRRPRQGKQLVEFGADQNDSALSPRLRRSLAALAVGLLTLLATARMLTPSPRGLGTHEQLGLSPCWIHEQTAVPCPSCGMTTAWAHLVRGEVAQAAAVHLAGTLAGLAAMIAAPWLLISAVCGRWSLRQPRGKTLLIAATLWVAVAVLDWLRRIMLC